MNSIGARQVAPVGGQPARGSQREQQAQSSAGDADQQALGHLLANERETAAAQRRADGDLFAAGCRARHQQVGEVQAGDQQHAADGAEQHQQRAS
jgi:hypothetical protein